MAILLRHLDPPLITALPPTDRNTVCCGCRSSSRTSVRPLGAAACGPVQSLGPDTPKEPAGVPRTTPGHRESYAHDYCAGNQPTIQRGRPALNWFPRHPLRRSSGAESVSAAVSLPSVTVSVRCTSSPGSRPPLLGKCSLADHSAAQHDLHLALYDACQSPPPKV